MSKLQRDLSLFIEELAWEDDWAQFQGIRGGWFNKAKYTEQEGLGKDNPLYRFGTEENKAASEWLKGQNIPEGEDVGDHFKLINDFIESLGFEMNQ